MAPFRSILRDMEEKALTNIEVWYFFGARNVRDVYYLEDFIELEKRWPNFHFVCALSGTGPDIDEWQGEKGIITDVLDRYLKEKIDVNKPKEGYLCGSPGMIDACNTVLSANGIPLDKIYYDKF